MMQIYEKPTVEWVRFDTESILDDVDIGGDMNFSEGAGFPEGGLETNQL